MPVAAAIGAVVDGRELGRNVSPDASDLEWKEVTYSRFLSVYFVRGGHYSTVLEPRVNSKSRSSKPKPVWQSDVRV